MRCRLLFCALLLACFQSAVPAHAGYRPMDDRGWLEHAVQKWQKVVGYRPCHAGHIELAAHRFTNGALAHAHTRSCRVHLNEDKLGVLRGYADWRCLVTAHEVGHLADQDHNDNPRSIMHAILPRRYQWCPSDGRDE